MVATSMFEGGTWQWIGQQLSETYERASERISSIFLFRDGLIKHTISLSLLDGCTGVDDNERVFLELRPSPYSV